MLSVTTILCFVFNFAAVMADSERVTGHFGSGSIRRLLDNDFVGGSLLVALSGTALALFSKGSCRSLANVVLAAYALFNYLKSQLYTVVEIRQGSEVRASRCLICKQPFMWVMEWLANHKDLNKFT